jgi:hypothetical protein
MGVAFDPEALDGGAAEFVRNADALLGHSSTVEGMAALRTAFAGSGEIAWRDIERQLTGVLNRLRTAQEHAANAGGVLRTAAGGSATIDQNNADSMRM